jgi:hypothetical protein
MLGFSYNREIESNRDAVAHSGRGLKDPFVCLKIWRYRQVKYFAADDEILAAGSLQSLLTR